ncbi:MAG: AAA family ATPase, partial [Pseudomonadales bacterium]
PGNIRVAYILNAKLDSRDALASICSELDLEFSPDDSIKGLTDLINRDLLRAHGQGKKTLVVIEEAQNLDPDVLEMLRLLTNLETNTAKLAHILLVGQPELLDLIARNELRQLNQRVISRFHLEPLDLRETANYLAHRLRRSGCNRTLFDSGAVRAIHRLSGGVPRVVNLLAERSLLGAYATNKKQVSAPVVQTASNEVFGARRTVSSKKRRGALVATSILFASAVGSGAYFLADKEAEIALVSALVSEGGAGEVHEEPIPAGRAVASSAEQVLKTKEDRPTGVGTQANSQLQLNAFEQLLSVWGISASVADQVSLCLIASQNGLICQRDAELQLAELFEINRPGLVRINPSEESQHLYMLNEIDSAELLLSNSRNLQRLALDEFEQQWDGEFVYLWPALDGYRGLVVPGTKNPRACVLVATTAGGYSGWL